MQADPLAGIAEPVPEQELTDLFRANPWLATLEPFYVEWELIWMM